MGASGTTDYYITDTMQEKLPEINYRKECEKLQRQIECETLKRLWAEQALQDNFKKQLQDNISISAEEMSTENRHPVVVTAVPWHCQRCHLPPEGKKSRAVLPKALAQRRARKLLAKLNAEKDGVAGSDTEMIPIAVQSKNFGRPKGPKPPLYIGSTEVWHALSIEQRKVISRRIKRLSVYVI